MQTFSTKLTENWETKGAEFKTHQIILLKTYSKISKEEKENYSQYKLKQTIEQKSKL